MAKIRIKGNKTLSGTIRISGAKNSVVALLPAAILCDEEVTLTNTPNISDVSALEEILQLLNAKITKENETINIKTNDIKNKEIPESQAKRLRASYYFMGALLGRFKKVEMYFPGGCVIGKRPINFHLEAFKKMGATIIEKEDLFIIEAEKLHGARIKFKTRSVGATINIMLAAVKAEGTTIIKNAAQEPEIENVAELLNNMGAKITGAGTKTITIKGVTYLHKATCEVIPDRIEAATYLIIGSLLGDNLTITNINPKHINPVIKKLKETGVKPKIGSSYITVKKIDHYKPVKINIDVYPGFPTDIQQPFIPLLTQCEGKSTVMETIWENRFQNIPDTVRMGANITVEDDKIATIKGKTKLTGQDVTATDLRGGASMVICGLIAEGTTTIDNIAHILRGYNDIVDKLKSIGADIELID